MRQPFSIARRQEREDQDDDRNVFALLADQARDRTGPGLWTTAVGGIMNAALIWRHHSGLHWLAAGFAAVAAYGLWGLADRARSALDGDLQPADARRGLLSAIRAISLPVGVVAAVGAVAGFMAAALGGWNH